MDMPNESFYADRASYLDALGDFEKQLIVAAGEATCGEEPTPEQIEAYARYSEALKGVRNE